jgi:hypothetical protein
LRHAHAPAAPKLPDFKDVVQFSEEKRSGEDGEVPKLCLVGEGSGLPRWEPSFVASGAAQEGSGQLSWKRLQLFLWRAELPLDDVDS